MTGMKEGAGEDPFAENTDDSATDDRSDPEPSAGDSTSREQTESRTESSGRAMQIPYKFRRDGVQDGRDRVPLFLQEETKRAEREALREMEERFDANVSLTDLREALMKVGLAQLDDVEQELEAWGYGMTFEE